MTSRRRRGPLWIAYRAFDRAHQPVAWGELLGGLTASVLTLADVLPPLADNLFAKIVTALLWFQVAERGYDVLHEELEDDFEGKPVLIARCPEHGLHGERDECFVCGGPVEKVPMVPA